MSSEFSADGTFFDRIIQEGFNPLATQPATLIPGPSPDAGEGSSTPLSCSAGEGLGAPP